MWFTAFAFVLAAAVNLEFVYPPELFPTDLRASGVGVVVAGSRIGSAGSTFLLPVVASAYGTAFGGGDDRVGRTQRLPRQPRHQPAGRA